MSYQGIRLPEELMIDQLFSLHYFEYMNSFYFPGESHPFWEFVCVDKGDVTIGAGDRSFVLSRGQIAFHEPGEFHWVKAGEGAAPCLIVISFSCDSPMMDFFRKRSCISGTKIAVSLDVLFRKPGDISMAGWMIPIRLLCLFARMPLQERPRSSAPVWSSSLSVFTVVIKKKMYPKTLPVWLRLRIRP